MASLNSRLQLALLNRKKSHNLIEKGFTLVELMIVIVIVGVLSAVALPNLLGNRDRAEAQSQIGSMVSYAKQCSTNMLSSNPLNVENVPNYITMTPAGAGGSGSECFNAGAAVQTTFATNTFANFANIEGVSCGRDAAGAEVLANGTSHTICTLTVNDGSGSIDQGVITGVWS